ncbi:hypothetical protein GQR58_030622 [Nymphon striatum]|nr:hypothetical protein GQR58_030622 [Nymphon striatum]
MLRQLFTLFRGHSADASQAFLDANATALLRQQLREAASGVQESRKAVAVVMAYAEREKTSLAAIEGKIADLETRACDALAKGADDIALEAATAIANLEAERDATNRTITIYTTEIVQLRQTLGQNEALLGELKRGQRIAEATGKTQRIRGDMPSWTQSDLADASETLKRLQERQQHNAATMEAMAELSSASSADALSDRMATAGFGTPKQTAASDVLARLKKTTAEPTASHQLKPFNPKYKSLRKGFYAMAAIMLVSSTAGITKAIRDTEESQRLHNKLEDAHTERLLSEVSAGKAA